MKIFFLTTCVASLLSAVASAKPPQIPQGPLDAAACGRFAAANSATAAEADARLRGALARRDEVAAVYSLKLTGRALLAPSFTARGSGLNNHYRYEYKRLSNWGPYTSLELTAIKPLHTFGRAEAGVDAAQADAEVHRARLSEAQNKVALEARKLYHLHLSIEKLRPALRKALEGIGQACRKAETLYAEATGDVTEVDLAKLHYAQAEVHRFLGQAEHGSELSLLGLKQVMGVSLDEVLELDEAALSEPPDENTEGLLEELLSRAAEGRPEWTQLREGLRATQLWERAERRALLPTLFAAASVSLAWTPTRDRDPNPWHYDMFNRTFGGIALGLNFDIDPRLAAARGEVARAERARVAALARFAETGIALQVRRAHDDVARLTEALCDTRRAARETGKWLTFALSAYASGSGEARDVIEGLLNELQAKKTHFDTLLAYHNAVSDLHYATGEI